MRRFAVKGPGNACEEITAETLDQAILRTKERNPDKQIEADAAEVLYICEQGEDPTTCQNRLR